MRYHQLLEKSLEDFESKDDYINHMKDTYGHIELPEDESPIHYDNWIIPSEKILRKEFEIKQKKPAYIEAFKQKYNVNIFDTWENFSKAVSKGNVRRIDENFASSILRKSSAYSLEEIEDVSSYYAFPRFPRQILKGFYDNDPIPMPLIIHTDDNQYIIIAGNTRLQVAELAKVIPNPKVLVIPGTVL